MPGGIAELLAAAAVAAAEEAPPASAALAAPQTRKLSSKHHKSALQLLCKLACLEKESETLERRHEDALRKGWCFCRLHCEEKG